MKQLNPKSVWLFFTTFIIRWSVVLLMAGYCLIVVIFVLTLHKPLNKPISPYEYLDLLWIIISVVLIISYIWAKLSYENYHYELADLGFKKESGVIYKQYVTIPYDRIQNVDIHRGILARILDLSDLQIQTAGLSGTFRSEGQLPGLSRADAEQLRNELIQRARQSRNQGL